MPQLRHRRVLALAVLLACVALASRGLAQAPSTDDRPNVLPGPLPAALAPAVVPGDARPEMSPKGASVVLQADDGAAYATFTDLSSDAIELVKMCPEGSGVITGIRMYLDGAGLPATVGARVWGNFGNYDADFGKPLVSLMTWSAVAAGWNDVPVPAGGIRFDTPPCFWVGLVHAGLVDPKLVFDAPECVGAAECTTTFRDVNDPGTYCLPNDQLRYGLVGDDCNGDSVTGDFADVDYLVHVDFTYDDETTPVFADVTGSLPRASRVAWGDHDGDGDDDLHLDGRLYRNDGGMSFVDVSAEAFPGLGSSGGAGAWGDYDNDGILDLFAFGMTDRLWHGEGDGTFTDVTAVAGPVDDGLPTEAAAWADYDRDGFLDVYKANYEDWNGGSPIYFPDVLLRGNGDGTFSDATAAAGLDGEASGALAGRGVNWGDYDGDGCIDLHVSNYRLNPNLLYRNDCDGTFTEVGGAMGVRGTERSGTYAGAYGHTIGSQWGDFDNDLDLDLLQGQLRHQWGYCFQDPTFLWRNDVSVIGTFTEVRGRAGIEYQEGHSDVCWGDVDADGDLDFYVTHVYACQPAQLYLYQGAGRFRNVTNASRLFTMNGWGVAMADADGDGDLDVFTRGLHRNDGPGGASLRVRLRGVLANAAAIGARVVVEDDTGRRQLREVEGGKGTGTQSSLAQHFGLGGATPRSVEVTWPSACPVTRLTGLLGASHVEVEEPCTRLRRGVAPDALADWRLFDRTASVTDADVLPAAVRYYDTRGDETIFVRKNALDQPVVSTPFVPWRALP